MKIRVQVKFEAKVKFIRIFPLVPIKMDIGIFMTNPSFDSLLDVFVILNLLSLNV